jgi:peptide/nickel transport system permease protein
LVSEAQREEILSRYDLEGSNADQFVSYVSNLARGDLGTSIRQGRPVSEVIGDRLLWSLLLVGTAVVMSSALGIALGFAAGWRRGSRRDASILSGVLAVDALPAFFVGLMLLLVFSVQLGWFPVYGAVSAEDVTGFARVLDIGRRLVLPGTTLTLVGVGSVFVVARSAMISETGEDYVFMARAKGLDEKAVRSRDFPLLQGVFLLFALVTIVVNLANDLLYPFLDPRVRQTGSREGDT